MLIRKLSKIIKTRLVESALDFEPTMVPFGFFGLISLPLFHCINSYLLAPQVPSAIDYHNSALRITCGVLCAMLTVKDYWPKIFRPYLPLVWYTAILLFMPFFATYMLLQNHFSAAWLLNALSIFTLTIWLVDWITYTLLLFLGITFAALTYYLLTPQAFLFFIDKQPLRLIDVLLTFTVSIVMALIFRRHSALVEKQKLKGMQAVGASIAHELRTPLTSIHFAVSGIQNYMVDLIMGYELAKQANLPVPYVRPDHYKTLKDALSSVKAEVNFSHTIVDMLLLKVNFQHQEKGFLEYSINSIIEEALQRYPFNPAEKRSLVNCNIDPKNDFIFQGQELLMIHVIFNLIKNALYYIETSNKGTIYIWAEKNERKNILYFKDTGQGMSHYVQANLFKKFFTNTHNGTGLGLSFCKSIMEMFGGNISCNSQEGEYAEFVLSFPALPSSFDKNSKRSKYFKE